MTLEIPGERHDSGGVSPSLFFTFSLPFLESQLTCLAVAHTRRSQQGVMMRALSQRVSKIRSRARSGEPRADFHAAPEAGGRAESSTARSEEPVGRHSAVPDKVETDALVITRRRAGLYALSDAEGHTIGQIYGDYVVGFTAQYGNQTHLFDDIDDAKAAIAELHASERGAGSPA